MSFTLWTSGLGIALVLAMVGVTGAQQPNLSPDTAALAKSDNAFAADLYQQLRGQDGNLFFSPYSISNALAMTYAGARGKTADDMAATLKFPFPGNRLHAAFAGLVQDIDRKGEKRKYQLNIANRLWGEKGYGFLPEFVKMCQDAYGAGLEELNFSSDPEKARQTIRASKC